jgi:hypothetical protein
MSHQYDALVEQLAPFAGGRQRAREALADAGLGSRFGRFDNAELKELWEALAIDDGIRYTPEPGSVEERLLREVEGAMRETGWPGAPHRDTGWTYQ